MKHFFITGTPNAGKSTLAKRIADKCDMLHIDVDSWREKMWQDESIRPWVDFFKDKDEMEYWSITTPEEDFQNLVNQSEAFWPFILKNINAIVERDAPAVFEAVNILPHLAKRDLPFDGVVLVNTSVDTNLERLKIRPRWGASGELQKIEAVRFAQQADLYVKEAEKYGFRVFENDKEAEAYMINVLKN